MPYEPLYHKYRPQSFAELVGQDAISTTLSSALRQQRIAHAYLLTGPRGTGKTSSARILAKSLNCIQGDTPTDQPCGVCEICRAITQGSALDVIEIDAASNTGVDNIRELIERSQFAPAQCRYKVYVIDECHMLSTAAFNALLKTLEEPPPRVVFVLATTDPQRVLPTIISRCQRFDFRRIPLEAMVSHLGAIAQQESINIQPDALLLVAQIAQGGLRDAESLLDQLSLLPSTVTVEAVWDLVGAVPEQSLLQLVQRIQQNQPEQVLDCIRELLDRGREPLTVLQSLASFYRDLLIAKTAPNRTDLVTITPQTWQQLCAYVPSLEIDLLLRSQQQLRTAEVQVKNTTQPRLWLEVTILGLMPAALLPAITPPHRDHPLSISANPQPVGPPPATPAIVALPPLVPSRSDPQPISLPANTTVPTDVVPVALPTRADDSVTAIAKAPSENWANSRPDPAPQPVTPAVAATVTPAPSSPDGDLNDIWNQVIAHIQPNLTQVLAKQQCRLLTFRGSQARVGVKTQSLLKVAQSKLPNFEAAFQQVVQRVVKVTLEVTSPDPVSPDPASPVSGSSIPAPSPSLSSTHTPVQSVARPPVVTPDLHLPTVQPMATTAAIANVQSVVIATAPPSTPQAPLPNHPPIPTAEVLETAPTLSPTWQEPDELDRAARSLAEFFRGQVVNLEGGLGEHSGDGGESFVWDNSLADLEEPEG